MYKRESPTAKYPRHQPSTVVLIASYGLATMLVIMVTAQLMTYDKFVPIVQNYQLGNMVVTKLLAATIVIGSVSALPFLMRMSLSPLLRFVSVICLLTVSSLWLLLGLWDLLHDPQTIGSGVLGGVGQAAISSDVTVWIGSLLVAWSCTVVFLLRKDILS